MLARSLAGGVVGGYFVNHSTGFIIEDVRVNGGAVAASTATPEKKGKASGGRDDGKRTGERSSTPAAGDDSVVREGYPALKSERQKREREGKVNRKKNGGEEKGEKREQEEE